MLTGKITYRDGEVTYKYDACAEDSFEIFSCYLTSGLYDAMNLLSESHEDSDYFDERRFDVHIAKVNVQTRLTVNEKGKRVKRGCNSDFFCRLGALIRYVKSQCNPRNEEGYLGLSLASAEFEAISDTNYVIRFPKDASRVLARVTLSYGIITSLHLDTDTFSVELDKDDYTEQRLFYSLKDAWTSGIRFTSEYLGFDYDEPQIIPPNHTDGLYHTLEEIMQAHPEKELSWLREKDYHIVTDETLEEVCTYIMNHNGLVYYDTETTGLKINFYSRLAKADQCVGIILSVKYGESFFFPMQMKYIKNLCGGDHFYFMERYMRPILEGKDLVAHNAPFDWKVGYVYGINCNIVHDTMTAINLTLAAERKDHPVGLKDNAKLLLKRDSLELSDLVINDSWGENDIKFWDLPEELVKLYACADTDNTNGILQYVFQTDLLGKYNARKVYDIEIAFGYAVAYQEFYGHHIDITNIDALREEVRRNQESLMKQMVDIVGYEFNPNSSPQLLRILYKELGIPEQISRKTGRPTTDKETLQKLAELTDIEDNIKYPFVGLLLEYRKEEGVRKIIDTFPEFATQDGYIFSDVWQFGTTTGRVSIHNPNYQSYNDAVKKNIIARPGFWAFDTDYSSVEYRVLGSMVGNENIKKSFEDPDFDYHTYQAAHMYRVPYASVTKSMRKGAKGINFGLPYGMGDESLGVRVFGEASPENTRKAAALRSAYFKGQEDIRDWFEFHRDRGVNEGFTETFFGRRRYYHRSQFSVNAIRRQAGNQVIQGTAADIYKMAVGRVFKRICKEGWLGKVLLTGFIHDELFGEVSNDINPAIWLKVLREEFEVKIVDDNGTPWCPLYMGFGYGTCWYEAKSVELPIKLQWELVDKYGETGFDGWDGNMRAFADTVPDMLRDFEIRDIRAQITDADSQGKEIKAALNSALLDCVKTDSKLYKKGILEACGESEATEGYLSEHKDEISEYLDKTYHIQCLYKDGEVILTDFAPAKSTQDALTQYCILHGVDRSLVNLLDIEEFDGSGGIDTSSIAYIAGEDDDEEVADEEKSARLIENRVRNLGLFLDVPNKKVYLLGVPSQYTNFIKSNSNTTGDGYQIFFMDLNGVLNKDKVGQMYSTTCYLTSEKVQLVQQMYFQYFRQNNVKV